MAGHTPFDMITRKSDSLFTKVHKRYRRWKWRRDKPAQARAGNTTSGFLSQGERDELFRNRPR